MTQAMPIITTSQSGTQLATDLNNLRESLLTCHAGETAPSYLKAGSIWYDTTNKAFMLYDGTQSLPVFGIDAINHLINPPIGGGIGSLASASTTNLGSVAPAVVAITGTTTITGFGSSMLAGQVKLLNFSTTVTIQHSANLYLPNAANVTMTANDSLLVVCTAAGSYRAFPLNGVSSAVLDKVFGSTQGSILYRGASAWSLLAPGTDGQVLTTKGAGANPEWDAPATNHGKQVFTSSGSFTVPEGITTVYVSAAGGGGGGGASGATTGSSGSGGGGGGAGQHCIYNAVSVTAGETYTITIGSGGSSGNAGGTTSFSTLLTRAGGGAGGSGGSGTYGGVGGSGYPNGGSGCWGFAGGTSGSGAASPFGGGGGGAVCGRSTTGGTGYYGGGGGGGYSAGGAGGSGILIVEW